ncbi:MAG: M23 family metallopeptidase [Sphaerochaetaceae bacterium]|nr:M23 family metallopeptidase [Sphaerochaetaceae bacterium]
MGRDYDDYSDVDSGYNPRGSSRLVLAFILLAILICIGAVLVWTSIKPSSESTAKEKTETVQPETVTTVTTSDTYFEMPEVKSDFAVSEGSSKAVVPAEPAVPAVALSLSESKQDSQTEITPVVYYEHTVKAGESVAQIAASYGISIKTIYAVNSIRRSIEEGDILIIPDRNGSVYTVQEGDTLESVISKLLLKISPKTLMVLNSLSSDELVVGTRLFIPSDEYYVSTSDKSSSELLSFYMPVDVAEITGLFNQSFTDPLTGESTVLDGVILKCVAGSPVKSVLGGTVVDIQINQNGTYAVKFSHAGGYTSFINCLSSINITVSQRVSAGEVIGTVKENNTLLDYPAIFFRIELDGVPLNPGDFIYK